MNAVTISSFILYTNIINQSAISDCIESKIHVISDCIESKIRVMQARYTFEDIGHKCLQRKLHLKDCFETEINKRFESKQITKKIYDILMWNKKKLLKTYKKELNAAREKNGLIRSIPLKTNLNIQTECSICMETYMKTDMHYINLCKHEFCRKCLNQWLKNHTTCPLCRSENANKRHAWFERVLKN